MRILVTGGAGYIGSHAVRKLIELGHDVSVIDNLYRGHAESLPPTTDFVRGDICDLALLTSTLESGQIEAVMHFAALAYVGESVSDPLSYYQTNTAGTLTLLTAMRAVGVNKLVFSSTCATYGEPDTMPIVELTPQNPINAYGRSKLYVESALRDYLQSNPAISFLGLRYFNVAGASFDGEIGEDHTPETHLIPLAIYTALGKRDKLTVFGSDYPTPDGTCVRDYVHVEDLVDAHILALGNLAPGKGDFYNIGIGRGYSVMEVIDSVKRVTGIDFSVEMADRRPGDPPTLYANADRIKADFGWSPKYTDLDAIVETAWRWYQAHPDGYSRIGS